MNTIITKDSQGSVKKTAQNESPTDELARLRAENAELKAKKAPRQRALSFKVGKSGGISVYGLGRFPVTLYTGQWERLFRVKEDIAKFAQSNAQLIADTITAKEEAKDAA